MKEPGIKKEGIDKKLLEAYRVVFEDQTRKKLDRAIARRGMSYEQIAFRLGTTSKQVHLWMSGENLDLSGMAEIALAIGCKLVPSMRQQEEDDEPSRDRATDENS